MNLLYTGINRIILDTLIDKTIKKLYLRNVWSLLTINYWGCWAKGQAT